MKTHNGVPPAFQNFAIHTSKVVGSSRAFLVAVIVIGAWAASGRFFHYSDTWQLWINTGTTIVTFLMVFLIQYTQNRDARAMHLKLDELLRAVKGARTEMADLGSVSDEDLGKLEHAFERLAHVARRGHEIADAVGRKLDETEAQGRTKSSSK
jgi:low affinity Fe/Cu permease